MAGQTVWLGLASCMLMPLILFDPLTIPKWHRANDIKNVENVDGMRPSSPESKQAILLQYYEKDGDYYNEDQVNTKLDQSPNQRNAKVM